MHTLVVDVVASFRIDVVCLALTTRCGARDKAAARALQQFICHRAIASSLVASDRRPPLAPRRPRRMRADLMSDRGERACAHSDV